MSAHRPTLLTRPAWRQLLESVGCEFRNDDGSEELWTSAEGRAFLVPYLVEDGEPVIMAARLLYIIEGLDSAR